MNLAISKAKNTGIGLVTAQNSNHCGAASSLSMLALEHGMVGFCASTSHPGVAPYGGISRVLGNHPLSYAIPAKNEPPVVLDMACGVSAWGRVATMRLYGKKLTDDWVLDADGKPTDDPAKAQVLLPFGGVKGYALAVVMDALTGPLSGGIATCRRGKVESPPEKQAAGHIFYAINIDCFVPLEEFKEEIDLAIQTIRNSRRAEGVDRIYLPGEIEWLKREKWLKEGIPLHKEHVKSLEVLAHELSVPIPWR
jgi:LDH2 family malate/lactate/ureidoglycolate dehydrogenase